MKISFCIITLNEEENLPRCLASIADLADEIVIVEQPKDFFAVGQVYHDFHHLSDEEVISLIDEFEQRRKKQNENEDCALESF